MTSSSDVLRGTLDLLILQTLADGTLHGWGIGQRIQERSRDALQVGQGSLYPALKRLEARGWVESEWRQTPEGRRARYYRLSPAGRTALGREVENWRDYVQTVELILQGGTA